MTPVAPPPWLSAVARVERAPAAFVHWRAYVDADVWCGLANTIKDAGGRLLALWGSGCADPQGSAALVAPFRVEAVYLVAEGAISVTLPLGEERRYPSLVPWFISAKRREWALFESLGLASGEYAPWLQHGAWADDFWPLSAVDAAAAPTESPPTLADAERRARLAGVTVSVEGEAVHEIAVGPVHAGIIEPGHFRFSVMGEQVLRLEQRFGYVHKGIERRLAGAHPFSAHRLVGRISGDSTVAYAWAYAMALESLCAATISDAARYWRVLLLERERIANHLGDIGALANDAGFAFALAQFSLLREYWQQTSAQLTGHRLMMDAITPGGIAFTPPAGALQSLKAECARLSDELAQLKALLDDHAGVQDRWQGAGTLSPASARELSVLGFAARASGDGVDLRVDWPMSAYAGLCLTKVVASDGDVAARANNRFAEITTSLSLIEQCCDRLNSLEPNAAALYQPLKPPPPAASLAAAGCVEAWRGPLWLTLELTADSASPEPSFPYRILRCSAHDPSWSNWLALERAIVADIVPDFPLVNKSFNLTYSGVDL